MEKQVRSKVKLHFLLCKKLLYSYKVSGEILQSGQFYNCVSFWNIYEILWFCGFVTKLDSNTLIALLQNRFKGL